MVEQYRVRQKADLFYAAHFSATDRLRVVELTLVGNPTRCHYLCSPTTVPQSSGHLINKRLLWSRFKTSNASVIATQWHLHTFLKLGRHGEVICIMIIYIGYRSRLSAWIINKHGLIIIKSVGIRIKIVTSKLVFNRAVRHVQSRCLCSGWPTGTVFNSSTNSIEC